jgi:transposase
MTARSESEDGKVQRRRWAEEERRRIVAESFERGASVSVVARRHDINTNLLFTWRRRYGTGVSGSGDPGAFVPAVITNDALPQAPAPAQAAAVPMSGRMEIELPGGCRLIVGRDVDPVVLGRVIRALLHR